MTIIGIDARWATNVNTGIGKYINEWLIELIEIQDRNQYKLFIGDISDYWGSTKLREAVKQNNGKVHLIPFEKHMNIFPAQFRMLYNDQISLPIAIRNNPCDLLFMPYFNPPLVCLRLCVITITDLDLYLYSRNYSFYKRFYYNSLLKISSQYSRFFIAISEATRQDASRVLGIEPERIHVIYPACSSDFFPRDPAISRQWIQKRFGIAFPYVLYTGGFSNRKNIGRMLAAFARTVVQMNTTHRLVLTGDFSQYPSIKAAIEKDYSRFVFPVGPVDESDLPFLYSASDLLVYPSLYEGFGLPIIEAQACGIPVVTSNVSSMPEIASDAAIFVDPMSVDDIAKGIFEGIYNTPLRENLKKAGLKNVKRFSWHRGAEQLVSLFSNV